MAQCTSKTPNELKDYLTAYFDILGYKQFIENNSDKVSDFLKIIHDCVSKFIAGTLKTNELFGIASTAELQFKIFSDNFLVCLQIPENVSNFVVVMFLKIVAEIQAMFVTEYSILIRGGVARGLLSFNDDYVFGEGLIKAVELEKKAIFPRIIVDSKLYGALKDRDLSKCENCYKRSGCMDYLNCLRNELVFRTMRAGAVLIDSDNEFCISYLEKVNQDKIIFEQIEESIKEQGMPTEIPKGITDLLNMYRENKEKIEAEQAEFFVNRLKQHKKIVITKVKEDCDFRKVSTNSDLVEFQKINCKYKYVLEYHNMICEKHGITELRINFTVITVTYMYKKVDYISCVQIVEDSDKAKDI